MKLVVDMVRGKVDLKISNLFIIAVQADRSRIFCFATMVYPAYLIGVLFIL